MRKILTLAVAAGLALGAAEVAAQACIGIPSEPGQFKIGARYISGEVDRGLEGSLFARLDGLAGAGGIAYRRDEYTALDVTGSTITGTLASELPLPATSVCLVAEPALSTYSWPDGFGGLPGAEVQVIQLPVMLGVGQRLDFGTLYLLPSARAGAAYIRTTADRATDAVTDTEAQVIMDVSLAIGSGQTYANLGFRAVTGEGTRPRLFLGVGFLFP